MNQATLSVKISESGFENIYVTCPHCQNDLTFNRITDLPPIEPIGHRAVACHMCKQQFSICGDSINHKFQQLILDSNKLISQKYYMYAILNCCQAFECFFVMFLRYSLICKNIDKIQAGSSDLSIALESINNLESDFYKHIETLSYYQLRNTFISYLCKMREWDLICTQETAIRCLMKELEKDRQEDS